ncbi:unnamed protein product [Bursaphelenchus okinawaensis]|uniref:Uncharacterized protein n=1 Tax=Bursaphelenchus okinawaensis TaxID=465554 RepID=A0A811KB28_9BILA|nr:unnamed protein product [Bursaphelenchus okinawaensis]CAG9098502.1 unnamed protein product [Bursaphelenchus okinawaensis]
MNSAYLSLGGSCLAFAVLVMCFTGSAEAQDLEYYPVRNQAAFYFRPRPAPYDVSAELGGRVELPVGWNRRFGKRGQRLRRVAVLDSLGGRDFLIR